MFEAVAYTLRLSEVTRQAFRLPTVCEQERATRGLIGGRVYPWSDALSPLGPPVLASAAPTPVDASKPNPVGLHGMADGVHECCLDGHDPGWYARSPADDPQGPTGGTRRVSHGGSRRHAHAITPCAARSNLPPALHYTGYGFRVVSQE